MLNKIRYVILICGLLCGLNTFAQGETCATALPAILGTNTSATPIAGGGADPICSAAAGDDPATDAIWYTYTPTVTASVTISSCLGGDDTRLSVTTGACGSQTCVAYNEDFCAYDPAITDEDYASQVTFVANGGTTYYVQWDDRWVNDALPTFDWSITETVVDCPALLANIGDVCDFVGTGDGIVNAACECAAIEVPDCATYTSPADGSVGVPLDPANDGVTCLWNFNGIYPETGVDLYLGPHPDSLVFLVTFGAGSLGVIYTGLDPGTLYYWAAIPVNSAGPAVGCDIWSFETEGCTFAAAPDCPVLVSPADGATGVVLSVDTATISWTNALTGATASDNGIYFGTDPSALNFLGAAAGASETINITGVQQGITYYWSIAPSNCFGEASGCPVFSFTVAGTPECPLLGLNGLNIGMICDDGDATTLFDSVLDDCTCAGIPIPGNATCGGAELIESDGTYTANQIIGGGGASNACWPDPADTGVDALWYSYTPTCDGDITIRSSIDPDLPDTRLSVFTGACGATTCVAFNDDVDAVNFSSSVTFPGVGGTTYLIEWDDTWGIAQFDFEVFSGTNCRSDLDGPLGSPDGFTDGIDFSSFLGNFGLFCGGSAPGDPCACPSDLNHDGVIDGLDFSEFLGNFGLACPAP